MANNPALAVRLFLNIGRRHGDPRPASALVGEFVALFFGREWPVGCRPPLLYYDPRSLNTDTAQRASLHAKCIVVDERRSFISSANFTEAAQERNIEAGVVIDDAHLARALRGHLDALVGAGFVQATSVSHTDESRASMDPT
jgi:phosphatidylserine/phosphatidylglycerophosphate/cardiolipin synthase-like enzyme